MAKLSQVKTSRKQPPTVDFTFWPWVVACGSFDCNLILADMHHTVHAAISCKNQELVPVVV